MKTTALLLIDLQRDFLEANGRMPIATASARDLIETANQMLRHAELRGWHIVFVKNEFKASDRIGNFFRRYAAIEGSAGAAIDPRITLPLHSTTISKARPNAFSNQDLAGLIQNKGIENLVVLGLMAEGCVRATVRDALKRRLSVTVLSDGVVSTRDFLRRFGLKSMLQAGAKLKKSTELLREVP